MSSTIKTVIIVLVLSGIVFFGYNYLNKTSAPSDTLLTQTSANTSKMGAEVLSALNQLKILKLDGSIFQDKIFLSLQDTSISLTPEPVGRINPFSPIGVENASAVRFVPASTTRATSTQR
jgi:hypothetical protein